MRTFRNATRELDNDTFGGDFWVHKPYKPNLRVHAARISKEEWRKHETRIRELHAEGCTSEKARQILRNESQIANGPFNPSAAQYTAQLKALGLSTYNTKRRHGNPREIVPPNDLRHEDVSGDEELVAIGRQQRQDGHSVPFKETLRSIPEGRDISNTPSTSAADSAMNPNSTPRNEISGPDELMTVHTSIQAGSVEAEVSQPSPLKGLNPAPLTCRAPDLLDETYVLEDGGPLLTFLKIVDPRFAYEPTSTVLRFWPQFASDSMSVTWSMLSEVGKVADCLRATRSYADAFDLYYMVFCNLHKTLDTYIRRHLLTTVLNCARSSSTVQQDECAIAVLRLTLRDQERGVGDHVSAGVLHLHLGELYKKQKNEKSEVSTMTAIQHITKACGEEDSQDPHSTPSRARTVLELDFPQPLYTSLILQSKTTHPAYTRYFTPDSENPASRLALDIKSHKLSKYLLKWCADVIASKARYLNHLALVLTGDTQTMRKCIGRLLFCCCLELWLKDTRRANDGGRYFSEAKSALKELKMPSRESLSAISFVILDEAFRHSDPLSAIKKRWTTNTLTSHLVRTIKAMLGRISETEESFTDTFLAFVVASGDDRRPSQVDELSRKVLEVFAGNIVSSGILRQQRGSQSTDTEWIELTPIAADLQGYVLNQSNLSRMLYTPRSSFSSGASSLRALHAELDRMSVISLSTLKSKTSLKPPGPNPAAAAGVSSLLQD